MTIIKKNISGIVLFLAAVTMFSCNLEDFNMNKLANPDDVIPDVLAPLAYGTFKVEDLVSGSLPDFFPIPSGGLKLDSVTTSKAGTNFRTSAIDSVYLVTHVDNDTSADMKFEFSFLSAPTGPTVGKIYHSVTIPAGAKNFRVQFDLGPADQDDLQNSSIIKLSFQISSPDAANPILYNAIKKSSFTIKISFYAPVKLWEFTK